MEFLRKLIIQTKSHLRGLTPSQRLAIGSCAALIVVALLWLMNWAREPAFALLLDQPMTTEELSAITDHLDAQNVAYQISGDKILVPAEQRNRLRGQLTERQLLPSDTSLGFTRLIEESNPFLSADQHDRRWTLALSNELAKTLSRWSWVKGARVFINDVRKRKLGGPALRPSASVNLTLKSAGELEEQRVRAVASFVAGAVPGLELADVHVIDSAGRAYNARAKVEGAADDLEVRQKKEAYFAEKIMALLQDIPGLRVAVTADLDPESRVQNTMKYGEPVLMEKESETDNRDKGTSAQEPGVRPNTTVELAGGGPSEKSERERGKSTFKGDVDYTQTTVESARYGIKRLFASVLVPRSHLVAIYKGANGNKEPTDQDLDAAAGTKRLLADVERKVLCALGAKNNDKGEVEVGWCYDGATVGFGEPVLAGVDEGVMKYVHGYGGKVGLGLLAAFSLLLMLMMVRRVGEGPVLPGEEPPQPKIIKIRGSKKRQPEEVIEMTVGGEPIGEAEESEPVMVAKEVDESTLQTQRVVDQIKELITEDPVMSAGILQRWIDSEQ